jgi:hypothetical protein
MAGWLFADLALVLAFVFLDSSAKGQAGTNSVNSTTTTTTTSTTVINAPNGVRPNPIVIQVPVGLSEEALIDEIEARLRPKLRDQGLSPDQKFLMVIISGGAQGLPQERIPSHGTAMAQLVWEKIKVRWERISNTTYDKTLGDGGVPDGFAELELFPVVD